ncbi:GNAT family N-acetyltransferase [Nocardioides zeae]|uniref:GNAT family N-acetyltransferase n=1 Tax=Nocardioides imazamoxiresistens TaxID=3231893 RepID=A0ABU3Q0S5_9ACTN|nr:GNAT family N-acetyltransferase [Nocardioides zeae]MDT9594657.1 GNAT family N-acetyltransferase [Nocardioides zeae]
MSDIELRGLTPADLPALDRLLREVEAVDRTDEHYNLADLREEAEDPLVDLGRDWVGAFDAGEDHRLVGSFRVTPRAPGETALTAYATGCTHPERRGEGIGTRLAEAMLDRLRERHHAAPTLPAHLHVMGLTSDEAQGGLLAGIGFAPHRYALTLGVGPLGEQDLADPPTGLRIRAYDPEVDLDALRETHNVVFRDHPGSSPWTPEEWTQWVTGSRSFRPGLSVVAVDASDAIVGYVQTEEYDAVEEVTGRKEAWIARVGTVREHRGRGLAPLLLRHVLEACRAAGFDRASLEVDSENPSGALGVYERAGFELEQHWTTYRRDLEPLAPAPA